MISNSRKKEKALHFIPLRFHEYFLRFILIMFSFARFNDEKNIVKMHGYKNYFVTLRHLGTLFSRFVSQQSAP